MLKLGTVILQTFQQKDEQNASGTLVLYQFLTKKLNLFSVSLAESYTQGWVHYTLNSDELICWKLSHNDKVHLYQP